MARRPLDITLPSLTGRRAVLTGGSDGIGLQIATRLAAAGAHVVLPVRNSDKGAKAIATIKETVPAADVTLGRLDLSSLESVAAFTQAQRDGGQPIHLLLNNAGVMTPPQRQTTIDGFEVQFGTNHLGHVALIAGLMPLLRQGRARVTSQVSIAAASGHIDWDDLDAEHSYDAMASYRQSKIALGLFGLELQRRSVAHGWGITSNLSHPGVAPTNLLAARADLGRAEETPSRRMIAWLSARGILVGTPRTAALPALLATTSPTARPDALYGPSGPGHAGGAPAEQALYRPLRSPEDAARIWTVSQELVGLQIAND